MVNAAGDGSYYELLGVDTDASPDEIQQAWISKTKEVHADKTGESDTYETVLDAGEVLKTPEKREAYDLLGHEEFVDRFGPRGNEDSIDIEELQAEQKRKAKSRSTRTQSPSSSGTSSQQSRTTRTTATGNTAASTSSTGSTSQSRSTRTGNRRQTETGRSQTQTSTSTGASTSSTSTGDAERSAGTASETSTTDAGETTESEDKASVGTRTVTSIRDLLYTVCVRPLVRAPVTMRVICLLAVIVGLNIGTAGTPYAGSEIAFGVGIGAVATGFAGIRWIPDYLRAEYPSRSSVLSRLSPVKVLLGMGVATGVAALATPPIVDVFVTSSLITIVYVSILLLMGGLFAVIGVLLWSIVKATGGGSLSPWSVLGWSFVIGVILALVVTVTTFGGPAQQTMVQELFNVETPWAFAVMAPVAGIRLTFLFTFALAALVMTGFLVGGVGGVLLLFHQPQQHAARGHSIHPTVWETAAAIPVLLTAFALQYGSSETARFVDVLPDVAVVTGTGLVEVVWVPLAVLVAVFGIREWFTA